MCCEHNGWGGLIATSKLSAAVTRDSDMPEMKAMCVEHGIEPQTTAPERLAQLIRREILRNTMLTKNAGLAPD